jgi:predicted nucleic acid-binding Zn ribbon protein
MKDQPRMQTCSMNPVYKYKCAFCPKTRQIGSQEAFENVPYEICNQCGIPVEPLQNHKPTE